MKKEMHSTQLFDNYDTHGAFYSVLLNINITVLIMRKLRRPPLKTDKAIYLYMEITYQKQYVDDTSQGTNE